MMNAITEAISYMEKKVQSLEEQIRRLKQGMELLKSLRVSLRIDEELPITMSGDHDQRIEKIIEPAASTESGRDKLRAERPKGDSRRSSKYKGVTAGRCRADGTKLWRAYVWRAGRVKYLGSAYESQEAAAAAAAAARGDAAEARVLAGMAEQAENNPDRPSAAHWECNRCGLKKHTKERPAKCDACGRRSFLRITADGKG